MSRNVLIWFLPSNPSTPPRFIWMRPSKLSDLCSDQLVLSDEMSVLYNKTPSLCPNPNLRKFGSVMDAVTGDAIIVKSDPETGEDVDVPLSIEQELEQILDDY